MKWSDQETGWYEDRCVSARFEARQREAQHAAAAYLAHRAQKPVTEGHKAKTDELAAKRRERAAARAADGFKPKGA